MSCSVVTTGMRARSLVDAYRVVPAPVRDMIARGFLDRLPDQFTFKERDAQAAVARSHGA